MVKPFKIVEKIILYASLSRRSQFTDNFGFLAAVVKGYDILFKFDVF